MPRSSGRSGGGRSYGGGSYSGSSSPRSSAYSAYRSGTYITSPPTYQRQVSPVGTGGLGSTIAHGMAFGGGSALAHHAIGSMLGRGPYASEEVTRTQESSSVTQTESGEMTQSQQNTQFKTNPCIDVNTKFIDCLKVNKDDISKCQSTFNDVLSCEKTYFS
jgi:hypothetical protein